MSYDGILIGSPSFVAGASGFGQALSLNGSSQYVSLPEPGPLDFASGASWTIEVSCATTSTTGLHVAIGLSGSDGGYLSLGVNNGVPYFAATGINGGAILSPASGTSIADGATHTLLLECNSTGAVFYVDGQGAGAFAGAFVPPGGTRTSFIGGYTSVANYWSGTIDEVRISNVVRQTGASYTVATAPFASDANTVALYHFDGNATDSAGGAGPAPTPVLVAGVGDSITCGVGASSQATCASTLLPGLLQTALGSSYDVTGLNCGFSGSTSSDWLPTSQTQGSGLMGYGHGAVDPSTPGSTSTNLYNTAKAAIQSALTAAGPGVQLVLSGMLGTNDSRTDRRISQTAYRSNMAALATQLLTDFAAYSPNVILHYPPYAVLGSIGGIIDATSVGLLQTAYPAALASVADGTHIYEGERGAFAYFQANPSHLVDGVHPDDTGHATLAQEWSGAIAAVETGAYAPSPVITSATTATATVGQAFTYQITASGSPTSFLFGFDGAAIVAAFAGGLSEDDTLGTISGTPTQACTLTFSLSATNAGGTGTGTLTLTVSASPVSTSATTSLAVLKLWLARRLGTPNVTDPNPGEDRLAALKRILRTYAP